MQGVGFQDLYGRKSITLLIFAPLILYSYFHLDYVIKVSKEMLF